MMPEAADESTHLLYVLRHAKSSWKEPGLQDHERPLAPRGRKAAQALGRYLEQVGIQPSLVLCSSARRARETYEQVNPGGELEVEPALYGAGADEVIGRVRVVPESTSSVMVIGHNPALQLAVLCLVSMPPVAQDRDRAESVELRSVREKFPTCALATVRFGGPWRRLGPGRCELVGVVRPADVA